MTEPDRQTLFDLGEVTATPAVERVISDSGDSLEELIARHANGDWGNIRDEGQERNRAAIHTGDEIVSEYRTGNGAKIRIRTDAADAAGTRPATAILLASEAAVPVRIEANGSDPDSDLPNLDDFYIA